MRLVIQRVSTATVTVGGVVAGSIGQGLAILVGFTHGDDEAIAGRMAEKAVNLRIFDDGQGRMNRSILEDGGSILAVSQFTLYADCRGGRRPSFTAAAEPRAAEALYQAFIDRLRSLGVETGTGSFGSVMRMDIRNEGPVTIILDSRELGM